MPDFETLRAALSDPRVPLAWGAVALLSAGWVLWDLRTRNRHLMSLMQAVWTLTALSAGPVGVALYRWSGRKEIARDGLWRRGARSVAHCYSGCGIGEAAGLALAVGLLGLGVGATAAVTFAFAYAAGFGLTVGPLMQEGVPIGAALRDAALSETPSIVVMEAVAIGVDLTLAGPAGPAHPLFWSSLILSLLCGLLAAWPVNVALVARGVKAGMMDPRMTERAPG